MNLERINLFLKVINIMLFKRRHIFFNYALTDMLSSFRDVYLKENFPSNPSIRIFLKHHLINKQEGVNHNNGMYFEIAGDFNPSKEGYTFSALYFSRGSNERNAGYVYKAVCGVRILRVTLCRSFVKRYFFFGRPKYIHFNVIERPNFENK